MGAIRRRRAHTENSEWPRDRFTFSSAVSASSARAFVSILSALGQGTSPNSLRDPWRTSGQSNRVLSAYDRACPSLAAGARQGKQRSWRTLERFCPPLASAIAVGGVLYGAVPAALGDLLQIPEDKSLATPTDT